MTDRLIDIEDISPEHATILFNLGLSTTDELLDRGATPAGRRELAAALEIDDTIVLRWVNNADLFRISGVGSQYADLLEEAGVDTVVELAKRNPANLAAKLTEVYVERRLAGRTPTSDDVASWVAQAKELPRRVHYADTPDAPGDAGHGHAHDHDHDHDHGHGFAGGTGETRPGWWARVLSWVSGGPGR